LEVTAAPARVEGNELEIGAGAFFMAGGATGGYMGVSPFLIRDMGESLSLRPSLVLGQSLPNTVLSYVTAARIDTCARVPGNYTHGAGIQLDVCGGADAGLFEVPSGSGAGSPTSAQLVPYIDLGPSVGLRAEVGRLAVMLRVAANLEIARDGYTDATGTRNDMPLATLRLELDFSWLVHTDEPHPADAIASERASAR
jgi:hypothetical protein